MGKPRLVLADDHVLVLEAFKKLLEPEFEIAGTAFDGRTLLKIAPVLKPDVILLDLTMLLLNGMDAGERLRASVPNTKQICCRSRAGLSHFISIGSWTSLDSRQTPI